MREPAGGAGFAVEAFFDGRVLQGAFQEDWQKGERRLMAGYLAGLGKINDAATAKEQLRQLRALGYIQ